MSRGKGCPGGCMTYARALPPLSSRGLDITVKIPTLLIYILLLLDFIYFKSNNPYFDYWLTRNIMDFNQSSISWNETVFNE